MRIAAIYIEKHEFIFNSPQVINFGGKFFYSFRKEGIDIVVSRVKNNAFIEGLFDIANSTTKVTSVNAIVGQNGAGKSSVLDIIRSSVVEHQNSFPDANVLILLESYGNGVAYVLRNDFGKAYLVENVENIRKTKLIQKTAQKVQTIYYSPHYDFKFNPQFDNSDDHDISFDKLLEVDLGELNEKDNSDGGWKVTPSQELLLKNSLRQIEFLNSQLVKEKKVFTNILDLPEHSEPIMLIRGYVNRDDWNTPTQFRFILKSIYEKSEQEARRWHEVRVFDGDRVVNQAEVNKYLLKRNVIKAILTLIRKQMERENKYLNEGELPKEYQKTIDKLDAYNTLLFFVKNSKINFKGKKVTIFKGDVTLKLLRKIYETIDKVNDERLVTNYTFITSPEDAIEILNLQRHFLGILNEYYHLFYPKSSKNVLNDRNKVEEFVNYMPSKKRLSSGENAFLNLFSRFYDFINRNFKINRFRKVRSNYILLLDEADLAFHPVWKRKYVKVLLGALPVLFEELGRNISIQIVFTTHDPLTLSDLPNANVIYIEKRDENSYSSIIDYSSHRKPQRTFGANIAELLADSFFVNDSLVGDFAQDLIKKVINWVEDSYNMNDSDYFKRIIQVIDEPILQMKLSEMFDQKMGGNLQSSIVDDQIRRLQILKDKLK
jgi:energy-coupling factor transporter ATP-binding protein EcfA2